MSAPHRIRLLLAERDPQVAARLGRWLADHGCDVTTRAEGRGALDALRAKCFDVALLDLGLPELDGLDVLRQVREDASPPEIILLADPDARETAAGALALGAYGYVVRPFGATEIELLVWRAWEARQLAREHTVMRRRFGRVEDADEFVTQYAPLKAVLALVARVARGDSAVLIMGERGTGKAHVARLLHLASGRPPALWVEVDTAAIPAARMESDLFGHERGASSGATTHERGLFELASDGTVLLAQVGALDPRTQGKLMRALEQGMFYRAGGTQLVRADFRIVATTSQDLASRVADGTFRADLYYRINTVSIVLPPLRERLVDLPPLARRFLALTDGTRTLSAGALDALRAYAWPGNVRELRSVIERGALVAAGREIQAGDLAFGKIVTVVPSVRPAASLGTLEEVEWQHIDAVLRHVNWHQGRAAEMLGISAKTLYRKIRAFGLRRPRHASPPHA